MDVCPTCRRPLERCGGPTCLLYDGVARAAALLEDLAGAAQQAGAVPAGLGGTIPLARRRVEEALAQIGPASRLVPNQGAADLGARLYQLDAQLRAWLSPADVAAAAQLARECRQRAYVIAWAYFAAGRS